MVVAKLSRLAEGKDCQTSTVASGLCMSEGQGLQGWHNYCEVYEPTLELYYAEGREDCRRRAEVSRLRVC